MAWNLNVGYTIASASPWLEIVNVGNPTPQQIEVRLKQPPTEVGLISSTPYPMVLDGVVVKVNGTPCPTFYTDPGQLAFQIPSDIATGTAGLVVERNGVASEEVPFVVQ